MSNQIHSAMMMMEKVFVKMIMIKSLVKMMMEKVLVKLRMIKSDPFQSGTVLRPE